MEISKVKELQHKYNLNNGQMAHFMGQCAHESVSFTEVRENLKYSEKSLSTLFKKYFTTEQAKLYARKPEKIANKIYANRMGNGSEASGDGYKHRGMGFIQLTGKENQTKFAKWIGDYEILNNFDLIASKYPLESALYFFIANNLFSICNTVDSETITKLTKRINGGTIGLDERKSLTYLWLKKLQ